MAAYGALLSLSHILHQILHPPPLYTNIIIIDRKQIELLRRMIEWQIDFLEIYSGRRSPEIAELEARIRDAAYAAEDIIESNVIDQIHASDLYRRAATSTFTSLTEKISALFSRKRETPILSEISTQSVVEEFISIEKDFVKMIAQLAGELRLKSSAAAGPPPPRGKISMVGFDGHLLRIKGELASDESSREVVPIVGMGGIGKTTLATAVYNDLFIVEHFDVRAWVTVSKEYDVQELIFCLLSEINKTYQDKQESGSDELGLQLYKKLFERKYLIVMDDMWDIQAWDEIKKFFPDNENGSRVLVTSRLSNLADDLGCCSPCKIDILDEEHSWDLFCKIIFGAEDCPVELVEIGKDIVKRCKGLPLALVLISGLLTKYERTRLHWESFAEDMTSALNSGNDEQVMKILSLSYTHLPVYLKPCFLYTAVFPEDFKIGASTLIRLWVAEGLIKPSRDKCLEEIANEYLDDLVSRNVISVDERGSMGNVKYCKVHDLVRDLCIRQAEKEKFLCIAKLDNPNISPNLENARRLSIYATGRRSPQRTVKFLLSASLNRSWLSPLLLEENWFSRMKRTLLTERKEKMIINGFRLLKVVYENDHSRLIELLNLSNLRFVHAHSVRSVFPVVLCWNLQTLVINEHKPRFNIPPEIWLTPQLRHLKMHVFLLPDPPDDDQNVIVLEHLQTIKRVVAFRISEQVLKRIPNLKKLTALYSFNPVYDFCLHNLVHFKKLESLGLSIIDQILWPTIAFPFSLKKLTLGQCGIPWEDLSIVGALPNLEVLKLRYQATIGEEWNPIEGQFCRLKFLFISYCELQIWGAENYHFPCLERLVLIGVPLHMIPMSFSEILPFQEIKLGYMEGPTWTSAEEISDAREELGYEPLLLTIY